MILSLEISNFNSLLRTKDRQMKRKSDLTSPFRDASQHVQLGLCTVWQYGLWSFQAGGTKLERFLHKNQQTQRKLLNFENWTNGEPQ